MLDLDARVDLHERHRAVVGDEEFHSSGAHVAGFPTDRDGGPLEVFGDGIGQERCRCLLDQLLVAALQRAVACVDRLDVAVRVGEDLHFDVARPVEKSLEEAVAVA